VDLVGTAVPCQGMHIPCRFLKLLQVGLAVVQKQVLVVNMVTAQQQPHGSGKGQQTITSVGGQFFIPCMGSNGSGQVVGIGQSVQAQPFVPDTDFFAAQCDIL